MGEGVGPAIADDAGAPGADDGIARSEDRDHFPMGVVPTKRAVAVPSLLIPLSPSLPSPAFRLRTAVFKEELSPAKALA
jgi:hypothetical protein